MITLEQKNSGSSSQEPAARIASIPKRLLSKRELAATLNISPRCVDTWTAQKRIPFLRFSSRLVRFSLPKVEAALGRYEIKEVGSRQ